MTIDITELYLAFLKRKCKLNIVGTDNRMGNLNYFVEITEEDGATYIVTLW